VRPGERGMAPERPKEPSGGTREDGRALTPPARSGSKEHGQWAKEEAEWLRLATADPAFFLKDDRQ
jgi:hypothetical protein